MAKVLKIRKKSAVAEEPVRGRKGKAEVEVKRTRPGTPKGRDAAPNAGRYKGKTSGLGVTVFQNQTIEQNKKKRMTDAQLAELWRREFPNARAEYTEETVRGVRNLYNLGKHGNNDGRPLPDHARVPEFDEQGQALPFWGEKSAAKRESAQPVARSPKKVVKKVGRR